MRAKAPWGIAVALAAPAPTWALGLGDIELFSALNQPFRAEIALTATAEELETLRVNLAERAVFERSGLERPAFMSDLQFGLSRNASGATVVSVRSAESVAEPFVTMIIEAAWSTGVLQREYTVFLDPPVLLNAPQAAAPIAAPQTRAPAPQQSAAPVQRSAPAAPAQTAPRPSSVAAPAPAASSDGDTYGPVQRAETLWSIAERYQPAGASMNQTMLSIYQANPAAFGGNMNSLRVGAILRIPPGSDFSALSVAAANAEVVRQNEAWSGGAAEPSVTQEPRVVLVPPSADSVTAGGNASAADESAGTASANALESEVAALRAELAERERLLELQSAELADLQDQLADSGAAAEPAVELPDDSVTAPGVDLQEQVAAENDAVFADEPAADSPAPVAEEPVAEAPEPAPTQRVVAPAASEPGLIERIVGIATSWIGMVVAGVGAILLAALWFMRRREDDVEDVTGQWDALEAGMDEPNIPTSVAAAAAPDLGEDAVEAALGTSDPLLGEKLTPQSTTLPIDDAEEIAADHFAQAATDDVISSDDTMSASQVMNLDEADPVAEADFHMAYGLYDQAAELLTKELQTSPERRDLRLKLLEVFFVWGNKDEFLDAANQLRAQMGDQADGDWDKVLIMGKQICPDAELFADAATGGSDVDVSLSDTSAGSLDFPFESTGETEAMDLVDIGEATSADLISDDAIDLDLTGNQPAPLTDTSTGLLDATGTLNIGSDTAASLEEALFDETHHGDSTTAPLGPNDETVAVQPGADPLSLAETQESPSLDSAVSAEDTMESPTVEQFGSDQPTVESPLMRDEETMLQATAISTGDDDYAGGTQELPTVQHAASGADSTAEIELNDLGLDVEGIDEAFGIDDIGAQLDSDIEPESGDTREQRTIEDSGEMLSATGITQVLAEQTEQNTALEDQQTQLQSGGTMLDQADVKQRAGAETELMEAPADDDFDLDLNDLEAALSDAETVEQPRSVDAVDLGFTTSAEATPIDLDIGEEFIGADDPTGTEDVRAADPQTLTEVGTKLDLARAYIDMGDPDGARSILEEVLSEGDSTQRDEAQSLIDAIGAA